jgi:hypothetical protein
MFLGVAIAQSALEFTKDNILGVSWYLLFYASALYSGLVYAYIHDSLDEYNVAIVGLIAVFLGSMPSTLQSSLFFSNATNATFAVGSGFYSTGLIMAILPLFVLIMVFGSHPESKFNKYFCFELDLKENAQAQRQSEVPEAVNDNATDVGSARTSLRESIYAGFSFLNTDPKGTR